MAAASYTSRLSPPPPPCQPPQARASLLSLSPPPSPSSHELQGRICHCSAGKAAACWVPAGEASDDGFGGWLPPEVQIKERNGLRRALAVGFGAPVAIALVGLSWHSPSRKCLKDLFVAPLHYVLEKMSMFNSTKPPNMDATSRESNTNQVSERRLDDTVDVANGDSKGQGNHVAAGSSHVSVKVPVDPMQQEAFSALKKLQIIENGASFDELCTRREFARWFVKVYSNLERKRKHKIVPSISIDRSVINAFNDVNIDDPDFLSIQTLGETGIVSSNLFSSNQNTSATDGSSGKGNSNFLPESYISRFDLVNWKALVEYPFAYDTEDKMLLSKKVGFLDLSACPDVSSSLLMDLMAGERSIVRRVFGNTRRLQPHKPVTKVQAAAALTSGRMEEAIHDELSRLEAENQSRLAEMAEIKEELVNRGQIQKYWEDKLKKLEDHEVEAEKDLQHTLQELRKERRSRQEELADFLKEKAALECQQQLLLSLRLEVNGMYDRLAAESAEAISAQRSLEKLSSDVSNKYQAVTESKSLLEAEKEALTILRSWVEEEAVRAHAQTEVLEKAVKRWRVPGDGVHKLS